MTKLSNKNIFLSSSCIHPKDYTIFSPEERIQHLRKTVDSCKRIEDSINVISEGSSVSLNVKEMFNDSLFLTYEDNETINQLIRHKQLGTVVLWYNALKSIEVADDANIFFLSGRYEITSAFDQKDFEGDYVFKKHWYMEGRGGWYGTQLYKISGRVKDEYCNILQECISKIWNGAAQDIECAIYQTLEKRNIKVKELEMVNCEGLLGPTGKRQLH